MNPADRIELAAMIPDELVDLILLARAADLRRSDTAMNDHADYNRYRESSLDAIDAWRDVGEFVDDWLTSGVDPVVPVDPTEVQRLSKLPAKAAATNLRLARSLAEPAKRPQLRLVPPLPEAANADE